MDSPDIILTRENIHALCGSPCGEGFTRKQLDLLGVASPPKKGWLSALRGKVITAAKYAEIKAACAKKWKTPPADAARKYVEPKPPHDFDPTISMEQLREAVNSACTCGGHGPKDRECCPACHVWHNLQS